MFKANSRRLLIGNIHVLYNPSRGDVKLGQVSSMENKNYIYIIHMWVFIQIFLDMLNTCVQAKIVCSSVSTLSFCDFKLYVFLKKKGKKTVTWNLEYEGQTSKKTKKFMY